MRQILLAVLSLAVLVSQAASIDITELNAKDLQFNYEDSISGQGHFAAYDDITMRGPHEDNRVLKQFANVSYKKTDHGSGTIEREALITSTESIKQIYDDSNKTYALVVVSSNSTMIFSPKTMSIGKGYYVTHPVSFNSLLSDRTYLKNYALETSMAQETDYAKAINKDLEAGVKDNHLDKGGLSFDSAWVFMRISESVTQGTARIGMLQGNTLDSDTSAWGRAPIEVDQVYSGTFDIKTNMSFYWPVGRTWRDDDWLPCCSGGFSYMNPSDLKTFKSEKGVFDCSCYKAPTKAQFQR